MNFSVSLLSISKIFGNSALISGRGHSFLFSDCRASFFSVPFFSSFSETSTKIHKTSISNFLSTSICVSNNPYTSTHYSTRQKVKENVPLIISACSFDDCRSPKDRGGALYVHGINVSISLTTFTKCSAKSSGAFEVSDSNNIDITDITVDKCSAIRNGGAFVDGHSDKDGSFVKRSNFTNNNADKWVGAIRIQHGFGSVSDSTFQNNTADFSGAVFMFTERPSFRSFTFDKFIDNKARDCSAAITCYLMCYYGDAENCLFKNNVNGSIHFSSTSGSLYISNCTFSGKEKNEINVLFKSSSVDVDDSFFEAK